MSNLITTITCDKEFHPKKRLWFGSMRWHTREILAQLSRVVIYGLSVWLLFTSGWRYLVVEYCLLKIRSLWLRYTYCQNPHVHDFPVSLACERHNLQHKWDCWWLVVSLPWVEIMRSLTTYSPWPQRPCSSCGTAEGMFKVLRRLSASQSI